MKKTAIFCVEEVESSKQGNTRSSEQQQARKHKWVLRVFSHLTASCRQVNLIPWHWQSGQSRPSGWVVLAGSSVPHDQLHTHTAIQSLVSVSVCVWSVFLCVCGQCVCVCVVSLGFTSRSTHRHSATNISPQRLQGTIQIGWCVPQLHKACHQTTFTESSKRDKSPFTLTRWLCHSYTKPVTKLPSLGPVNVTKSFHTHTVTVPQLHKACHQTTFTESSKRDKVLSHSHGDCATVTQSLSPNYLHWVQ